MKKSIIIIVSLTFVAIIFLSIIPFFLTVNPDLSRYEYLKSPKIFLKADEKVIVVTAKGDPNIVGKKAMELLFKAYYKVNSKDKKVSAPKARWDSNSADLSKSQWVGYYAMTVPNEVTKLPDGIKPEPGLTIELTNWEYGEVAEILHIGSYNSETPTIEKLRKFINDNGYEIIGLHEEEYLRGPGMFSKGDPKKYYTIIRYRIKKKV